MRKRPQRGRLHQCSSWLKTITESVAMIQPLRAALLFAGARLDTSPGTARQTILRVPLDKFWGAVILGAPATLRGVERATIGKTTIAAWIRQDRDGARTQRSCALSAPPGREGFLIEGVE